MKAIAILAILAFGIQACPARGQVEAESFALGEVLSHQLSVCLDKADAVEIVKADTNGGFEAGAAVWVAKDRCQSVEVVGGYTVGQVVFSAPIERAGKAKTMCVVEILKAGEVVGYFLTSLPVSAKPVPKGDPKSLRNSTWRAM